ncbi:MAG: 50S ribosomal protein L19, partial [Peptostreptococcales bacterium]
PKIDKIEIVKRGRVRRAKLNYMRDRIGKAARVKSAK